MYILENSFNINYGLNKVTLYAPLVFSTIIFFQIYFLFNIIENMNAFSKHNMNQL